MKIGAESGVEQFKKQKECERTKENIGKQKRKCSKEWNKSNMDKLKGGADGHEFKSIPYRVFCKRHK